MSWIKNFLLGNNHMPSDTQGTQPAGSTHTSQIDGSIPWGDVVPAMLGNTGTPVPKSPYSKADVPDLNDPSNKDTVPAMLTEGEFVLNKEATNMFRPQIEAMNEAGLNQRKMENAMITKNSGGMVPPMTPGVPVQHYNRGDVVEGGLIDMGYSYSFGKNKVFFDPKSGQFFRSYRGGALKPLTDKQHLRQVQDVWEQYKQENPAIQAIAREDDAHWQANMRADIARWQREGYGDAQIRSLLNKHYPGVFNPQGLTPEDYLDNGSQIAEDPITGMARAPEHIGGSQDQRDRDEVIAQDILFGQQQRADQRAADAVATHHTGLSPFEQQMAGAGTYVDPYAKPIPPSGGGGRGRGAAMSNELAEEKAAQEAAAAAEMAAMEEQNRQAAILADEARRQANQTGSGWVPGMDYKGLHNEPTGGGSRGKGAGHAKRLRDERASDAEIAQMEADNATAALLADEARRQANQLPGQESIDAVNAEAEAAERERLAKQNAILADEARRQANQAGPGWVPGMDPKELKSNKPHGSGGRGGRRGPRGVPPVEEAAPPKPIVKDKFGNPINTSQGPLTTKGHLTTVGFGHYDRNKEEGVTLYDPLTGKTWVNKK